MARKPPKSEIDKQLDALGGIDEVRALYGRVRTRARKEAIHDYIVRYEDSEAKPKEKAKPSPTVDTDKAPRVKEANALADKLEAENDKIRAKDEGCNELKRKAMEGSAPKPKTTPAKSDKDK